MQCFLAGSDDDLYKGIMRRRLHLALILVTALGVSAATSEAAPRRVVRLPSARGLHRPKRAPIDPKKVGANARVNFGKDLRPTRDVVGRRAEPLTAEEETAARIQKLMRGPLLRRGLTGLYVADARTGEPLFAVNADEALNPASNVKLISTATSLELLGPDFRFPTRVLGQRPIDGVVHGDIYLLGSHDPTLALSDLDQLGAALAARGITRIEGNVLVGSDPTRDGIYRAVIPIEIAAGKPGAAPTATPPAGFDLVEVRMLAKTAKRSKRSRLRYKTEKATTPAGQPRIVLTVRGTIGKGRKIEYGLWTRERTATAAYGLLAALRSHHVTVTGEVAVSELGDFVGEAAGRGPLPTELARHESRALADIVRRTNKWSVNWLADRTIMVAAALSHRRPPSMELAVDAMYRWLERHARIDRDDARIDTGSGLSYRTALSARQIVRVIRSAAGFTDGNDSVIAAAWRRSLAIAGRDGTLRHRFRTGGLGGQVIGKTGTLSTAIALSGILEIGGRPLAFSLVTNTDSPISKRLVRRAHEQVVREIASYVAHRPAPAPVELEPAPGPELPDEPEVGGGDAALDRETARQR